MERKINRIKVNVIKTAILWSQARAAKAVNQEMLALYYGIGRFISANTRNKNWGKGVLAQISERLRGELPGLRGFSSTNLKNMRLFYEVWNMLEHNSVVTTAELEAKSSVMTDEMLEVSENEINTIRQLRLTNYDNFPIADFLSISFTHHIAIINNAKELDERLFYIRYCHNYKPTIDDLERELGRDLFHHQGKLPNNFLATIPDYKQAFRAIQMFKDIARRCKLHKGYDSPNNRSSYTRDERLKMAQDYIAEHHLMRVRDYEAMTYLPHSTAANELRYFCIQPTGITSEGRGNTKVYVKRKPDSSDTQQ